MSPFHFLLPKALWLFIPLAVIVLLLVVSNLERKKWKEIIPPHLRPYLFTKGSRLTMVLPLLMFVAGAASCILALAAPSWKKRDLPEEKIRAVVLVALDCSQSMLATDIQPDRLQRAKFKLNDFLDADPRARTGLVAFAGSAHPVLPFTGDYRLIKQQVASITARTMPIPGTNMRALIQVVDSLMNGILAPSSILLLTDAIDADEGVLLGNFMQGSRHHLEIILFSTPNGGRVPGHPTVVSRQDLTVLHNLSQDSNIRITPLTLDGSDVDGIARRIAGRLVFEKTKEKNSSEWEDRGPLLLIPALLITLFWFRKGWVMQWCWLLFAVSGLSSCGVDSRHPDWWYSRDYQGQLLENAGRYEDAAARFDDDGYKAVAWFKAGNYEAAAELFATLPGASAAYNKGLALARLGRYDEAMESFGKAIDLNPALKEKAAGSLAQAKAAKQRADSILQEDLETVKKDVKKAAGKKGKDDPLKERKGQTEDEQLSSDTRVKKLPTNGNRVTDETASNIRVGKESKSPQVDSSLQRSKGTADEVLMRQSAADPAEFLRRRFELQVKRYYKELKKPKDPW